MLALTVWLLAVLLASLHGCLQVVALLASDSSTTWYGPSDLIFQQCALLGQYGNASTTVAECETHAISIGADAINYNADPSAPAVRCQLRKCSHPVAPSWSVPYWRGYATFVLPPPPPPPPPAPGALDRVLLTDAAARDGAVCLDGSPAAYYWRAGSGSGKNSWVLFLEGGGWCCSKLPVLLPVILRCHLSQGIVAWRSRCAGLGTAVGGFDSCLSRSHGGLGSSTSYVPTQ